MGLEGNDSVTMQDRRHGVDALELNYKAERYFLGFSVISAYGP